MLKKTLCICTVLALAFSVYGCQNSNKGDEKVSTVKQKETVATSKTEDKSNSSVSENYNLRDYMGKGDKILLTGKINNNLSIHMELKKTDKAKFDDLTDRYYDTSMPQYGDAVESRYEGTYYYDKYMKNIRVEAQTYANGYINIFEFNDSNKVSGSFGGFIFQDKVLKGMWSDDNVPKYSFYLMKSDASTNGIDLSTDTSRVGSYSRVGNVANNSTTLTIYSTSDDKIEFHINGYSKPNMGDLGGIATYTDSLKKKAEFYDKEDDLKITFDFEGHSIKVVGNDALKQFAGAHVTMSGTFVK